MTANVEFLDDPHDQWQITGRLHQKLLQDKKFDALEISLDRLRDGTARVSDGDWKYAASIEYLGSVDAEYDDSVLADLVRFLRPSSKDKPWQSRVASLRCWREAKPTSTAAAVALAQLYFGYAWLARGGNYSDDVPEAAWKVFFSRVRMASDVLRSAEQTANKCPSWYGCSLLAVKADQRELGEWYAIFERGVSAFPEYWPTYTSGSDFHLSRWSGSPQQMADFLKRSITLTNSTAGASVAARIAWELLNSYGTTVVDELCEQDWQTIREGFQDWMKLFPRQSVANYFLLTARVFDDKPTARSLIQAIGATPYPSVWQTHLSAHYQGYGGVRAWAGM